MILLQTTFRLLREAIQQTLSIEFVFIIVLVSLVGILFGALPGIGPAIGMIVFFPLTFVVDPGLGLALMAVMYATATYGSSIPAILINVPGSSGSAATLLDGYPMTQSGRGAEALGVSVISSFVGATIGLISIVVFAPLLARLTLILGPQHMFWLAVLGICTVSAASRGSLLKSLISACFGVFIASIGIDPITATPRFTFGTSYLEAGLDIIVILVGLFAISEVYTLVKLDYQAKGELAIHGDTKKGIFEGLSYIRGLLQGSVIGVIVGAIPGLGIGPANFLSYLTAMTTSSDPSRFGTGIPEGIVAAESSNNASAMSTLIPSISLAIPGSPAAAIFIGVMLTYGITPGPNVFESYLPYVIYIGIIFGVLVFGIVGTFGARYFSKVTSIPKTLMIISVTILSLAGSFAMRNNIFDVGAAFIIGTVGYMMREKNYSLISMIIAVILAPIAEKGFYRSLRISQNDYNIFVSDYICMALIFMSIAMLLLPILLQVYRGEQGIDLST